MSGKIIAIGTALPDNVAGQKDILGFMEKAYNNKQDARKLRVLFHQSGIEKRYSVLPDFGRNNGQGFFKPQENQPNVEDRMEKFKTNAVNLALSSIEDALKKSGLATPEISHLITVTCTGLHAPGLGNEIIQKLGLKEDLFQTSVNFLGCNAAFHALKIADLIANSDTNANILVVCVELCTLHFQPKNNTDNLLSNTIFGDGAATAVVSSKGHHSQGLKISGFYSLLLQNGGSLMGWDINHQSFEMILNAQLPAFIGEKILSILKRASSYYKVSEDDINHWAVHPGGKKILTEVKKNLGLNDEMLIHSSEVLRKFGNMSSPTILFVLKELMDSSLRANEKILAIGFGPGLSIDTSLLIYEN